jgi:hypothetical protein
MSDVQGEMPSLAGKPSPLDVLCGRGGASLRHLGNLNYRRLITINKARYVASRKMEKLKISRSIVEDIRDQGGRFLERQWDEWHEIGDKKAVEKTSQALREGQPKLRQTMEIPGVEPSLMHAIGDPTRDIQFQHHPVMPHHERLISIQQRILREQIAQHYQFLNISGHVQRMTQSLFSGVLEDGSSTLEEHAGSQATNVPSAVGDLQIPVSAIRGIPTTPEASCRGVTSTENVSTEPESVAPETTDKGSVEDHANLLLMLSGKVTRRTEEGSLQRSGALAQSTSSATWGRSRSTMSSAGSSMDRRVNPQRRLVRRRLFSKNRYKIHHRQPVCSIPRGKT